MKQLVLTTPADTIRECTLTVVKDVPVPTPKSGQVLIKMVAAVINPSDYGSWTRVSLDDCPKPLGVEGCGRVVSNNSWSGFKVGQGVGVVGLRDQGTYSEYVVADASRSVFALPGKMDVKNAASFFVNPYTAVRIVNTVREHKSPAFVHTAAASQLGQMLIKFAKEEGNIEIINVVRREEQAKMLREELGAEYVVVTSNEGWKSELKELMEKTGATVAFDAVGGSLSGDLVDVLPAKTGILYAYGGLAGGKMDNISVMDLIYKEKQVKGWLLTPQLTNGGTVRTLLRLRNLSGRVNAGLDGGWSSSQFKDCVLEDAQTEIANMLENGVKNQKLRILFEDSSENAKAPDTVEDTPEEPKAPDTVEDTSEEPKAPDTVEDTSEEPKAPDTVEDTSAEPKAPDTVADTSEEPKAPETVADTSEEPKAPDTVADTSEEPKAPDTVLDTSEEPKAPDTSEEPKASDTV